MSDTLSLIKRLQYQLSSLIEPDFGLLDQLLSLEVLTRPELADVRSERTVYRRTEALLDLLTTQHQCDKFIKVLKKTGQQHVVNYITHNGGLNQTTTVPCDQITKVLYCCICLLVCHTLLSAAIFFFSCHVSHNCLQVCYVMMSQLVP